jgi:hypothetical protein
MRQAPHDERIVLAGQDKIPVNIVRGTAGTNAPHKRHWPGPDRSPPHPDSLR